jgi:hypothetical protein
MKKPIKAISLLMLCLIFLSACGGDRWITYTNATRSVSFSYYSRSDKMSAFEAEDIYGVYRSGLFAVSITLQGGSRDMDQMTESLARFYTTDDVTVSSEYTESVIAGNICRKLSLSGEDIGEGGIFFFRNEATDVFYTIYYSISKSADTVMTRLKLPLANF